MLSRMCECSNPGAGGGGGFNIFKHMKVGDLYSIKLWGGGEGSIIIVIIIICRNRHSY